MIAYGIEVLPLIRDIRNAHPQVTQTWYADDAGAGGTFQQILEHFQKLQARALAQGCYPEPTKSILVVAPGNIAREEEHFRGIGIRVVTGHRYLVGYIGDGEAEMSWLKEKIQGWMKSVNIIFG